jgi:hypothetical protein
MGMDAEKGEDNAGGRLMLFSFEHIDREKR